jgi:hypothetical protein
MAESGVCLSSFVYELTKFDLGATLHSHRTGSLRAPTWMIDRVRLARLTRVVRVHLGDPFAIALDRLCEKGCCRLLLYETSGFNNFSPL